MDRIVRNLAVILFGAVASAVTIATLTFFGLSSDQPLLDLTAWTYVPMGTIIAGFLAAIGYYIAARTIRIRPGVILLAGVFAVSAGVHLFVTHLDTGILMATNRKALTNPKAFTQFAAISLLHTRLPDVSLGGGSSSSDGSSDSGSSSAPQQEGPRIDAQGDSQVEGMASGVGSMLAKADMGTQLGAGGTSKIAQMGGRIDSLDHGVESQGTTWLLAALQIAGFSLGGLAVYVLLRALPYCEGCSQFLAHKGAQTRYFLSERSLRSSVDDFHERMKLHQLAESIMAHFGVGSGEKSHLSEFASTIEIRECKQCHTHRLNFSARRKKGQNWQNIKVLGHTAESLEPIDVVRI